MAEKVIGEAFFIPKKTENERSSLMTKLEVIRGTFSRETFKKAMSKGVKPAVYDYRFVPWSSIFPILSEEN